MDLLNEYKEKERIKNNLLSIRRKLITVIEDIKFKDDVLILPPIRGVVPSKSPDIPKHNSIHVKTER